MTSLSYTRIPSGDPVLERIQDGLERIFNFLNQNPLMGCRLIENVRLEGGIIQLVPHGLGRVVKGCWPSRRNVFCLDIWMEDSNSIRDWPSFGGFGPHAENTSKPSVTTTFDLSRYVPVVSSSNVTVDLLVF